MTDVNSLALLAAGYAATGLFAGLMAGLFGVGGGIVMVPALSALLGLVCLVPHDQAMHLAVATSLAVIIPTSLTSLRAHIRHKAVDGTMLKLWMPLAALGAVGGALLAPQMHGKNLSLMFAALLVFSATKIWRSGHGVKTIRSPVSSRMQAALAFLIGGISTMVGIGGGALGVTAMTLGCGMPIHRAVGTSAALGVAIALPGSLLYLLADSPSVALPLPPMGLVDPLAVLIMVPFAMAMAPLGARLAHRLKAQKLRRGFAVLLLCIAGRMTYAAFA